MERVSNLIQWLSKEQTSNTIKNLSDNQILNIANDINTLFSETNLIESKPELSLPKLVVVGTQSSGKSSVLNALMAMDILPTGKNMVTRTPLDIRMHKLVGTKDGWVEFGYYSDAGWTPEVKIPITVPTPTPDEINKIRDFIKHKTDELAGNGMNISTQPIILDIYSPFVPNLSLTDLPGLTLVPCIDKGQPDDIKERIEEMVSFYIKQKRTIILAVMQSRSDLETDLGLALIKKHDTKGQRTIGILTKPDLMNADNHVGDYLTNSISKNLMLTYGYYVVKNRSDTQTKEMDIFRGLEMEKDYFAKHPEYHRSIYQSRVGMKNLTIDLNKILVTSITEMLPSVMTEMVELESKINKKLETMGEDLPETKEGKISLLNRYVSNFNTRFQDSIESRGTVFNTGKKIKDIFISYRENLKKIRPFKDNQEYDQKYFMNVISSFEGNHMSFNIPPVQVLEACMTDERLRPIMKLKDPTMTCIDEICNSIIDLIREITKQDEFSQYPPLANHILTIIVDNIISTVKMETKKQANQLLLSEESYIWTDSKDFMTILTKSTSTGLDVEVIKNMLEGYFSAIKDIISHNVPKYIMKNIVREVETTLLTYLIQNIVTEDKIPLLKENEDVDKQRRYLHSVRQRIISVKKSFSTNMT